MQIWQIRFCRHFSSVVSDFHQLAFEAAKSHIWKLIRLATLSSPSRSISQINMIFVRFGARISIALIAIDTCESYLINFAFWHSLNHFKRIFGFYFEARNVRIKLYSRWQSGNWCKNRHRRKYSGSSRGHIRKIEEDEHWNRRRGIPIFMQKPWSHTQNWYDGIILFTFVLWLNKWRFDSTNWNLFLFSSQWLVAAVCVLQYK